MQTDRLLAQRIKALNETEAQIEAVEAANGNGKYNKVLDALNTKRARQVTAVKEVELRLELGI